MSGKRSVWALVGRYSGLAFLLPASTFAGYALGWALDRLFETNFLYLVSFCSASQAAFSSWSAPSAGI
jgi:hypothetical protein